MTTQDFIIELFYRIDEELKNKESGIGHFIGGWNVIIVHYFHNCLKGQDFFGSF